MITTYLANNG